MDIPVSGRDRLKPRIGRAEVEATGGGEGRTELEARVTTIFGRLTGAAVIVARRAAGTILAIAVGTMGAISVATFEKAVMDSTTSVIIMTGMI